MWEVEVTDEFVGWWDGLDPHQQESVTDRVDLLAEAILLLGGDKSGEWSTWYEWAVPLADDLYDAYLRELHEEGLI